VNNQPDQPGKQASEPILADFGDCATASDGCHLTFVVVLKFPSRIAQLIALDCVSDESTLLDGHGCDTR
jgi:hypothetical protein